MGEWERAVENVGITAAFWHGKRVFLTGHTGFKGSWLSLWLQQLDAEVTGYALAPPTSPSLFDVARVADGMRPIVADMRDAGRLGEAVAAAAPDIVIHMAAQSLVRQSYLDPVQTYAVNLMGTIHLLEAVRDAPSVRAVVIVTSDKCYDNRGDAAGHREDDPLGGTDPYSNSKACCDLATSAYRESFFHTGPVAVATVRAGNVIGGGDWAADRLVPDLVRAAASGASLQVRNPNAIRPWQHVFEPLRGYLMLAERLVEDGHLFAGAWNFGPADGDHQPVAAVVRGFGERWGGGEKWTLDEGPHPREAPSLRLNCSKAAAELGWSPRWSLDRALDAAVSWHRAHVGRQDMRIFSAEQIKAYMRAEALSGA